MGLESVVSTAIAGGIGLVSAGLSYRLARESLRHAERQTELQRTHDQSLVALPKRLEALETVWRLLLKLESDGMLASIDEDNLVMSILWLEPSLRELGLALLEAYATERPGTGGDPKKLTQRIGELRNRIVNSAESIGREIGGDSHGR